MTETGSVHSEIAAIALLRKLYAKTKINRRTKITLKVHRHLTNGSLANATCCKICSRTIREFCRDTCINIRVVCYTSDETCNIYKGHEIETNVISSQTLLIQQGKYLPYSPHMQKRRFRSANNWANRIKLAEKEKVIEKRKARSYSPPSHKRRVT